MWLSHNVNIKHCEIPRAIFFLYENPNHCYRISLSVDQSTLIFVSDWFCLSKKWVVWKQNLNKNRNNINLWQEVDLTWFTLNCKREQLKNTVSNCVLCVLWQLPDRDSQSSCRCLPQSGHSTSRGSASCASCWLLQRRVDCQGQCVPIGFLTAALRTESSFRRWKSTKPTRSISQPEEVSGGCMSATLICWKIRNPLNVCYYNNRDIIIIISLVVWKL